MKYSWPLKFLLALCLLLPLAYSTHSFDEFATPKMAVFLCGSLLILAFVLYYVKGLRGLPRAMLAGAGIFLTVQIYQTFRLPYPPEGLFGAYGQSESLLVQFGFVALFFAGYLWIRTDRERNAFQETVIFAALLVSLFGIFQYYLGDPISREDVSRVKSLLGDPNSLGVYLVMVQPLLWWKILRETAPVRRRFFFGCCFLQSAVISLTFSRAAWAGLAFTFLWFASFQSRPYYKERGFWLRLSLILGFGVLSINLLRQSQLWPIILVGVILFGWSLWRKLYSQKQYFVHCLLVIFLLSIVAGQLLTVLKPSSYKNYNLSSRLNSFSQQKDSGRGLIWKSAWLAFRHAPWTGAGMGSFQDSFHRFESKEAVKHWGPDRDIRQVHNELLHYLATQGVVGLGSYLALLVPILMMSRRPLRTMPEGHEGIAALWSLIAGYLVFVQFAYALVHYSHLFWMSAGILVGYYYPAPDPIPPGPLSKRTAGWLFLALCIGLAFLSHNFYRSDVHYRKAFFGSRYRHFSRSFNHFRTTLRLAPWSYQYRYRYVYALIRAAARTRNAALARQHFRAAEDLLNSLSRSFPERYQVYNLFGYLYFQKLEFGKASLFYRKALRYFPENYGVYYRIVRAELLQGDRAAALAAYRAGAAIHPEAMKELLHSDKLKLSLKPF
ncbi:O-antigen ligase-like membrane protein [Hydrogenispora ethanolica]|uniref:O-antigen ligase-like membrane protein n=1 Tax=Hydrogenispora ethanolica TaxID=1082276 RepID=A0A4R1SBH1_HYDET|nr:O-antigen ligase family protein [Hydrogenispora ethanolica]TCL76350.1 O-antigen ligase-like membrane protein [Hydrogenispora ethanolica]